MCIICRGEYKNEDALVCRGCTLLTILPDIPNVKVLICVGCTSLTTLPEMPNVTSLYCYDCSSLTSLPEMPNGRLISCYNCTSLTTLPKMLDNIVLYCNECTWLYTSHNTKYDNNIRCLITLQRQYRHVIMRRYLTSREFIEWIYSPDNIGGKIVKKSLNNLFKPIPH
jgi:hypothetical protein